MVFARKADDNLASLVKEIEKAVGENKDKKLSSFVMLLGDDREKLEADAKKFVETHKITNVPVAVPLESENGPADFGVSPKAEVTVTLYTKMKVKASHAYPEGKFDKEAVKAVVADFAKILEK
ncbi:MAG: hypothetical protein HYS13_20580 [Planctomycetia bacterium]|nr:hypothetical protein [Planctomycetia bacterium]